MKKILRSKLQEALVSVLPVSALILILALTPLVDISVSGIGVFLIASLLLILGIGLFNLGADLAMTPMGQYVGEGLTATGRSGLLLSVCCLMGVLITVAEPDLSVLADQVAAVIPAGRLIIAVGIGVGLFLGLSVLKILMKRDLVPILLYSYLVLFTVTALLIERGNAGFLPLAFDSGGVTTGPITVPFIMALGVGIAMSIGGSHSSENSFGLVALCSIGPVLMVLLLSLGINGNITYEVPDYTIPEHFGDAFFEELPEVIVDVAQALLLIVGFFLILQCTILKLPKRKLYIIAIGIGYTFVGLVIFLCAVNIGYMPVGFAVGKGLAAFSEDLLLFVAFILGMVVVLAEPAIHVLTEQVEDITHGGVTRRQMLSALSLGVGVSLGLTIIRMIRGFSILYYLIPGYLIALGLSFFVPKIYTAIAFDSGGVASGPLTSGFILPLMTGACVALRGEESVLALAFGTVAMVAMTPLISIQCLGFRAVMSKHIRTRQAMRHILSQDDEQIIYFA